MKCNTKKTLLLDADGVFIDFDSAFLKVYTKVTGLKFTKDLIHYDLMKNLSVNKKTATKIVNCIKAPGFALTIKPYMKEVEIVKKLMKVFNVVFVTAPYPESKTWANDRLKWLEKYFGKNIKVVSTKEKYLVKGNIFVDDKSENVIEWEKHNPAGTAYVYDKPYNRDEWLCRIFDLEELFIEDGRYDRPTSRPL